ARPTIPSPQPGPVRPHRPVVPVRRGGRRVPVPHPAERPHPRARRHRRDRGGGVVANPARRVGRPRPDDRGRRHPGGAEHRDRGRRRLGQPAAAPAGQGRQGRGGRHGLAGGRGGGRRRSADPRTAVVGARLRVYGVGTLRDDL
ncbi:MAG: Diacylglycerol kinase, partial [uncultured Phycisphaerae bacterium]